MSQNLLSKLFNVLHQGENNFLILLSNEMHPVFLAHFESNPILPGFLHIDIIASLFDVNILGITKAKYFDIVRPSEKLEVKLIKNTNGKMCFEIIKESGIIASKIELLCGVSK